MGKTNPRQPTESTPRGALPSPRVPPRRELGVDPIEELLLQGAVFALFGRCDLDLDAGWLVDLNVDVGALLARDHIADRGWVVRDLAQQNRAGGGHLGRLIGVGHEGAWTKPVHAGLQTFGCRPVRDNLLLFTDHNNHSGFDRFPCWGEYLNCNPFFAAELIVRGVDHVTIANLCTPVFRWSDIGNR